MALYDDRSGTVLAPESQWRTAMTFKSKSAKQEVKGIGQKVKGVAQEAVGRATGDEDLRAEGELNQVGGHVRSRLGEAGRKISTAVEREGERKKKPTR
jgi:uncharacterized protein YjbJ (UPF0337 family)